MIFPSSRRSKAVIQSCTRRLHNYSPVEHSARKKEVPGALSFHGNKTEWLSQNLPPPPGTAGQPTLLWKGLYLPPGAGLNLTIHFVPFTATFHVRPMLMKKGEPQQQVAKGRLPVAWGGQQGSGYWQLLPCAWNGHLLQGLSALLWRQCQGHQLQHVANPTSQAPSWGLQVGVTLLLVFKGHSFTHWPWQCSQTSYWLTKLL